MLQLLQTTRSRGYGSRVALRLPGTTPSSLLASCGLDRDHLLIDLRNRIHAAQTHRGLKLLRDQADRFRDSLLSTRTQPVGIGAADHAGLGAERERAHHVLAGADAAVE